MDFALAVAILTIGAIGGCLTTYAFMVDKPLRDEFEALPEDPQHVARKAQA